MIIYKVTNLISGKSYIGQYSGNKQDYYGSGKLIKRAIQKYGIENFKKEILEICSSKKQLNEREIYWIKKLNSKSLNGYNLTDGGEGGNTFDFHKLNCQCSFCKAKRHELLLKSVRQKISKNHADFSGKNNPMFGKHLSEEHKRKLIEANTGRVGWNKGGFRTKEIKQKIARSTSISITKWWKKRKLQVA